MARVAKRKWSKTDPKTGERRTGETRKYYCFYTLPDGKEECVVGYTDKRASEQLAARLEKEACEVAEGLRNPTASANYKKLLVCSLCDSKGLTKEGACCECVAHLSDFRKHLKAKNNTTGYIDLVVGRLRKLFDGCGFHRTPDLSASKVANWLAEQRETKLMDDREIQGMSIQTSNYFLTHVKSFCRWMVRDGRMGENPLDYLQGGNSKLDRRHDRRELSAEELARILTATLLSKKTVAGLDGKARYVLYATACGSGFRASELASLTPCTLNLDGVPATATVPAAYTKNKQPAEQPIPADLVSILREYVTDKPADEPLWPGTWAKRKQGAKMLRTDLEAAQIPYVVDGPDGPLFADFHSLRHSYISLLNRGGVGLLNAQKLARHSTPNLTARYTHTRLSELANDAELLPKFYPVKDDRSQEQVLRATGTDGKAVQLEGEIRPEKLYGKVRCIPRSQMRSDALPCSSERIEEEEEDDRDGLSELPENTAISTETQSIAIACSEIPEVGLEPTHSCEYRILNPARLPFRHSGVRGFLTYLIPQVATRS